MSVTGYQIKIEGAEHEENFSFKIKEKHSDAKV
jgi:hypothetical protein